MHKFPTINYIGNKEKLVSWIIDNLPNNINSVFDAFSGGCSVSYYLKKNGYKVFSNDILYMNYLLAKALVENNDEIITEKDINIIFDGIPFQGYMFDKYAYKLYYPQECMELDLYRNNIFKLNNEYKQALAFTLFRRAMIRKMPYSRFNIPWDKIVQLRDEDYSYKYYKRKRAYHNQSFREHFINELSIYNNAIFKTDYEHKAFNYDIFSIIGDIKADLIYLDPPYTGSMNNYFSFYGILDEWIKNEVQAPFDNNFTTKGSAINLFHKLFSKLTNFKYCVLSYNNNAFPTLDLMISIITNYAKIIHVLKHKHDYKVKKKKKKNDNTEYLFILEV